MCKQFSKISAGALTLLLASLVLIGCATTAKIDWNSRIGNYTYDQAVVELGPPDKQAKLESGVTVSEWLTRRGSTYAHGPYHGFYGYGYYPYFYGPRFHPGYWDVYSTPSSFIRLTFGADGRLLSYKKFYK